MASADQDQPQSVRFSDVNEEIEPEKAVERMADLTGADKGAQCGPLSPQAEEELRNLSSTLQKSRCQARRMENFSFEPVSLPPSRAASPAPASRTTSGHSYHRASLGTNTSAMQSPPLTPAGTSSREDKAGAGDHRKQPSDPAMMTPQVSPPHDPPPTSMDSSVQSPDQSQASLAVPRSPRASPKPRPSSASDLPGVVQPHPRHGPSFNIGPAGDSLPISRDVSPSGSGGERSPGTSTPASASRPQTPLGDNPYTRSKRAAQGRNLDTVEARYIFGGPDGRQSAASSSSLLPRSRGGASDKDEPKRSSFFGNGKPSSRHNSADGTSDSMKAAVGSKQHHGSMSELKRFFKIGHRNKDKDKDKEKRKESPAPSTKREKSSKSSKAGIMTPPLTGGGPVHVPFADDHGLQSKYGKFGKVLGSGAGGSVRLMKRSSDGVTFAVKQFRARHSYESEKDYNKKVTAEFCIGSTLHHGNIIETMDLVNEKGSYFVVMEYAPFDLFAIVMTGKMSREEVNCCTLQILNGVTYLHNMGLAHRDLKLDNVVVNEHGIMKIIDFGSAAVFRYPFEDEIVLATGIVGSDPYLAPEVYDLSKYDPQPTDIWSLAIIFCCMTLRRFPWKAPRISDNSYKLFVAPPNDGPRSITGPSKSASDLSHESDRTQTGDNNEHRGSSASTNAQQPQVIKGPWRLLRLLPRESRHIVGRMLEVDPKKRATLDEIIEDKWVTGSQVCSQEEGGKVLRCDNHDHTLEPGAGVGSAPNTQQKK
ncbi:kinase-like protein [Ophiobolus disseminans]|uniref:non-specific serine/threonine protein kinase n=1 Tax=Ophiobolus disseminans TaxID=1469910 RepID=A0A6A7A7Z8_9PLEO|nr:kinase-like protein [Ophiobolus disseminans]